MGAPPREWLPESESGTSVSSTCTGHPGPASKAGSDRSMTSSRRRRIEKLARSDTPHAAAQSLSVAPATISAAYSAHVGPSSLLEASTLPVVPRKVRRQPLPRAGEARLRVPVSQGMRCRAARRASCRVLPASCSRARAVMEQPDRGQCDRGEGVLPPTAAPCRATWTISPDMHLFGAVRSTNRFKLRAARMSF